MSELGEGFNQEDPSGIDLKKFARLKSIFEKLAG
jgi:hypothetical protein